MALKGRLEASPHNHHNDIREGCQRSTDPTSGLMSKRAVREPERGIGRPVVGQASCCLLWDPNRMPGVSFTGHPDRWWFV